MRFSILPVEVKFFDHFRSATCNLLEAAQLLQALFDDFQDVPGVRARIEDLEHGGDQVVHEVTSLLVRTLVTPFSSEEIQKLIHSVDDALDTIHAVTVRLSIYEVTETRQFAQRLAHLITEQVIELEGAILSLEDKKRYHQAKAHVVRIHTLENKADDLFEEGLHSLVAGRGDMFDFIRWKEIYELLEQCTDRLEDASDVVESVIVSNA